MTPDELRELCKESYREALDGLKTFKAQMELAGREPAALTYFMVGFSRAAVMLGRQLEILPDGSEDDFWLALGQAYGEVHKEV